MKARRNRWQEEEEAWLASLAMEPLSAAPLSLAEADWPAPSEGWPVEDNEPFALSRDGTFFDEQIDFHDPEGDELTLEVLARLAKLEARKNKRSAAESARHYRLVRSLLANILRCAFFREPPRLAFFGGAAMYPAKHAWLNGRALSRAVKNLQAAGLVSRMRGFGGPSLKSKGVASRCEATESLLALTDSCGVAPESLRSSLPTDKLIRLKRNGKKVHFLATSEIESWAEALSFWNDFIELQQLEVEIEADEEKAWLASSNAQLMGEGPRLTRPELFRTSLYRSFVNDFDQHGRLYGGWWIDAPKHVRRKVRINGEPTIELDFQGCGIRMLYDNLGESCPGDPYELEAVTLYALENGLSPDLFRDTHKRVLNALINCGPNGRPENVIREHGLALPTIFSPKKIRVMLEEMHKPISPFFRSNVGLHLHRQDADLALKIICDLASRGIVALPIHDSFLTPESCEQQLRMTMVECYRSAFGAHPLVRVERGTDS